MTVKWFSIVFVLFNFSALTKEREKLVIEPASINDEVPEKVRNAVQALGVVSGETGVFINNGLFVAPITTESVEGPVPFNILFYFREATQREVEIKSHLREGEIVVVIAGQAQLKQSYKENAGSWGIFTVHGKDETELFSARLTTFLKFSEFQKGDKIFLLSSYYYKPEGLNDPASQKQNLMFRVVNPHIKNIGAGIDWERSFIPERFRRELNNTVAVNQRGEVIGFIRLKNETSKMVRIASGLRDFFSKTTPGYANRNRINGSPYFFDPKKTMRVTNARGNSRARSCLASFSQ